MHDAPEIEIDQLVFPFGEAFFPVLALGEGELGHDRKHKLGLVAEVLELGGPKGLVAPVGKAFAEPAVVALPGPPGEEVDHAHEAQALDEVELAAIEGKEGFVALDEEAELAAALGGVVGEEEPEILDRGPGHHVVEVDDEESRAWPLAGAEAVKDVAAVAVAVDAPVGKPLETLLEEIEDP